MNRKENRLRATFAPETRFTVRTVPAATFRATQDDRFECLKKELLARHLASAKPELNVPLRRAANEAGAIAWSTLFPLLVYPALFEEKVADALRQARQQARIYAASPELILAA
ncbi:MAG TPA: hypothetical protein VF607_15495 [Verrucomicrobiae bacterium]